MDNSENEFTILKKSLSMQELFEYSQAKGVTLNPKLAYPTRFYPGYLGILATESLSPYETILTATKDSFLSINLSNTYPVKQIFIDYPEDFADGDGGENNRFIAFILSELSKGPDSPWYVYLKNLPTDIEVLSDWTENELLELQDEVLVQYNLNKNVQENECNLAIQDIFKQYPSIIKPEFVDKVDWAWKVICTRAFGRCLPFLSLIPVADYFNHANVETNYYYGLADEEDFSEFEIHDEDHDTPLPLKTVNLNYFKLAKLSISQKKQGINVQSFLERAKEEDRKLFLKKFKAAIRGRTEINEIPNGVLKIVSPPEGIPKGKQVFIQYGGYSNRQLLSQYGFAILNNRYDYFSLRIELGAVYEKKNIQYDSNGEVEYLEFKLKRGRLCQELMQFICTECWDLEKSNIEEFFLNEKGACWGKVLSRYREIVLEELGKFETGLNEDLRMVKESVGYRKYFALLYRIPRKEILNEHLRLVDDELSI